MLFLSGFQGLLRSLRKVVLCTILGLVVASAPSMVSAAIVTLSLSTLFASGTKLTLDGVTFNNWHFIDSDDALADEDHRIRDGTTVIFSQSGRIINVDFVSDQFHSEIPSGLEGNYQFGYTVTTTAGVELDKITGFELSLLDSTINGTGNAFLNVNTCLDPACQIGGPPADLGFNVFKQQLNGVMDKTISSGGFFSTPQDMLEVSTRISVAGSPLGMPNNDPPSADANIHQFRQSFLRIPEPGTLMLVSVAGLMLAVVRISRPGLSRRDEDRGKRNLTAETNCSSNKSSRDCMLSHNSTRFRWWNSKRIKLANGGGITEYDTSRA